MKKCFKCGKEKLLSDFYKHNGMLDGHLNKCKECAKKDVKNRYEVLSQDEEYMEKERARGREKYHRLNYKERQKEINKKRPWNNYSAYKNLNRNLSVPKGFEVHHWSYKLENIKSVFIVSRKDHKKLHKHLDFIQKERCFAYKGKILDTKTKHKKFINQLLNDKF